MSTLSYQLPPATPTNWHRRIERVFSAPAWNRVIFANNLQLLYGDYLISSSETPDFIGTSLRFGSDELKTWEDIIVFFDRLGGQ